MSFTSGSHVPAEMAPEVRLSGLYRQVLHSDRTGDMITRNAARRDLSQLREEHPTLVVEDPPEAQDVDRLLDVMDSTGVDFSLTAALGGISRATREVMPALQQTAAEVAEAKAAEREKTAELDARVRAAWQATDTHQAHLTTELAAPSPSHPIGIPDEVLMHSVPIVLDGLQDRD